MHPEGRRGVVLQVGREAVHEGQERRLLAARVPVHEGGAAVDRAGVVAPGVEQVDVHAGQAGLELGLQPGGPAVVGEEEGVGLPAEEDIDVRHQACPPVAMRSAAARGRAVVGTDAASAWMVGVTKHLCCRGCDHDTVFTES